MFIKGIFSNFSVCKTPSCADKQTVVQNGFRLPRGVAVELVFARPRPRPRPRVVVVADDCVRFCVVLVEKSSSSSSSSSLSVSSCSLFTGLDRVMLISSSLGRSPFAFNRSCRAMTSTSFRFLSASSSFAFCSAFKRFSSSSTVTRSSWWTWLPRNFFKRKRNGFRTTKALEKVSRGFARSELPPLCSRRRLRPCRWTPSTLLTLISHRAVANDCPIQKTARETSVRIERSRSRL